jgi:hypothetical protein
MTNRRQNEGFDGRVAGKEDLERFSEGLGGNGYQAEYV